MVSVILLSLWVGIRNFGTGNFLNKDCWIKVRTSVLTKQQRFQTAQALENCRVGVHLCLVRNAKDANELESERNHESDALENIRVMKEWKKTLPTERKTSRCFLLRFIFFVATYS